MSTSSPEAPAGLGRATADVLVADGARVVVSGRDAERLDAAVAELGDGARRRGGRQRGPGDAGPADRGRPRALGRLDGALISVGGPPPGTVSGTPTRTGRAPSTRSSSAPSGSAREVCAALRGRRLGRLRAVVVGARADPRAWPSPTGCGPGWRWSPRRSPTSWARAASGSTGCCPAGSAPSGWPSSTRRPATPRRPGPRRRADPAGPLRRARGVRPGGGVPAVARRVLRHRRDAPGRRRDAPHPLSRRRRRLPAPAPRAARPPRHSSYAR